MGTGTRSRQSNTRAVLMLVMSSVRRARERLVSRQPGPPRIASRLPMSDPRRPAGYVGSNHETSGRDVLAVLKTVNAPEATLGKELADKLRGVTADGWYPIALLVDMLERLDQKLGSFHLKSVGWAIIQSLPPEMLARFKTAREVVDAFDGIYHFNNRGQEIGGWTVTLFVPGRAELEKNTPHHCVMEEGILEELLRKVGIPMKVSQSACFRKGAPVCRFVVEARMVDERWGS